MARKSSQSNTLVLKLQTQYITLGISYFFFGHNHILVWLEIVYTGEIAIFIDIDGSYRLASVTSNPMRTIFFTQQAYKCMLCIAQCG